MDFARAARRHIRIEAAVTQENEHPGWAPTPTAGLGARQGADS